MLILGLTKTTLLDYPGKVAATVFTGGCNFRCPFCHNGQLVTNTFNEPAISEEEVLEHLKRRRNILGGVCITGGEPTLQSDLPEFLSRIKELGYMIKLDTNGSNPNMLADLTEKGLIDYVAMDIKNTPEKYKLTTLCSERLLENVKKSVEFLKTDVIPYEFRTTVVRELHTKKDLEDIAVFIDGCQSWFIQSFKDSENVIERRFSAYSGNELAAMTADIKNIDVKLRGVE